MKQKGHASACPFLVLSFYSVCRLKILMMNETKATNIIAPNMDGTIAMPAICGPHSPKIACPRVEPTSPAIVLAMKPIDPPLPVMKPAASPIMAPTIKTQIQCNIGSPLFFPFRFNKTNCYFNDLQDHPLTS